MTRSLSLSTARTSRLAIRSGLALAAATLLASTAHAQMSTMQGQGLYVGASLGAPRYQDSINGSGTGGDSVAGKAYIGYSIIPQLAVETGFTGLGRVDGNFGRVKGTGGFIDAVGTLPLTSEFSLLGRVGAARVKFETPGSDDTGTGLKLGLGAQYALSRNVALRGEWERYRVDVFNSKPNVDLYTVGVKYSF